MRIDDFPNRFQNKEHPCKDIQIHRLTGNHFRISLRYVLYGVLDINKFSSLDLSIGRRSPEVYRWEIYEIGMNIVKDYDK